MVNPVSPGVYVVEKDNSTYPATIDSTTVGIVGFATKGPTNEATLITSQEALVDTFGPAVDSLPGQGLLGALEILEATNKIYYVRAVDNTALQASATIPIGACPAMAVSSVGIGVASAMTFLVQATTNTGASAFPELKEITVAAGLAETQQQALAMAIGTNFKNLSVVAAFGYELDANGDVVPEQIAGTGEAGFLVGSYAGSGASLYVSASDHVLMPLTISGLVDGWNTNELTVTGLTMYPSGISYLVESLYEGAGYNLGTAADGTTSGNSVEIDAYGGPNFVVSVNDKGAQYESFVASLLDDSTFVGDQINTSTENKKSNVIQGNFYEGVSLATVTELSKFTDRLQSFVAGQFAAVSGADEFLDVNPRFVKFVEGTYSLAGGTNGAPTSNYASYVIGDSSSRTGLYALDNDNLNLTIGIIPGLSDQTIQNALITLAETSQNFIAVVSPPYAKDTPQEAIDWSNGLSDERTASINSSYAAIYWPWVKTFIPALGEDKWLDPAIYGARQIAYTAGVSELWFAPAGFVRGRLTKPTQVQLSLNQGDRDSLYSGGNVVNPIVNFPVQGITIFGQRTTQRSPSALDRINVRMLAIYLRKVLLLSTQRFSFEPNDPILWSQIEETVNPLLDDIKRRRGITEFRVICDSTTNTPLRIDRNELWCKILLKPTKAAEAIVFELNITNQSAKIVG